MSKALALLSNAVALGISTWLVWSLPTACAGRLQKETFPSRFSFANRPSKSYFCSLPPNDTDPPTPFGQRAGDLDTEVRRGPATGQGVAGQFN